MAIYTNLEAVKQDKHGLFESSRLKASIDGRIYDAVVVDDEDKGIEVDNGVAVAIGDYTGEGLQEVKATVAAVGDRIAVVGTPAIVKTAFTKAQESVVNFTNVANKPVKAYEVLGGEHEVFAVADYQFTDASASAIKVGAYVVVDGTGMWVAQASAPAETTYGFIGKVHSLAKDNLENVTIVRIQCVKNAQVTE